MKKINVLLKKKAPEQSALKRAIEERKAQETKALVKKPGIAKIDEDGVAGLTALQLMKSTPALMRNNSNHVTIKSIKRSKTKKGSVAYTAICEDHVVNKRPRPHKILIIGKDANKQTITGEKQKVLISCDCESFVYTFEYANAQHGASKIIYGNGDPASTTNPGNSPGCCKHCFAVLSLLRDRHL